MGIGDGPQGLASAGSWGAFGAGALVAAGAAAAGYAAWRAVGERTEERGAGHRGERRAPLPSMVSFERQAAHRPYRKEDVAEVLALAISRGEVGLNQAESAIFYDMDAVKATLLELKTVFPPHFMHTFAVKSCPLPPVMCFMTENGLGMESASLSELQLSLRCGCPPQMLMFDSPAKTRCEIREALSLGVQINVDNFDELGRVVSLRKELEAEGTPSASRVAFRFNPLVGAGTIKALSVSDGKSKFGVPLTEANKERLIQCFATLPFLDGLHIHVGSQGFSLDQLTRGVATCVALADEIDQRVCSGRVRVIDIGGGLPMNYGSWEGKPTYKEYAALLKSRVPTLFSNKYRLVITEFGRSMVGKAAWCACSVEYAKFSNVDGRQVLILQSGADLFMRTAYQPSSFPLRITAHAASDGRALSQEEGNKENKNNESLCDVAGPLCFAGDMIATGVALPQVQEGDFLVIHDVGANTLSTFSRHCSRPMPPVYGYCREAVTNGHQPSECPLRLMLLKPKEQIEEVLAMWGMHRGNGVQVKAH